MAETRKKRTWLRALVVLSVIGALIAGGLAWLASSETAFAWALTRLEQVSPGKLKFEGVRGTLFGPIAIDHIDYADETLQVRASAVRLTWLPWALLGNRLAIGSASARHVSVRALPSRSDASAPASMPKSIAPPLRVSVKSVTVGEMELASDKSPLTLHDISLGYEGNSRAHRIRALRLATDWGTLDATAELGSREPFALTANAVFRHAPKQVARLTFSGTLRRIDVKAEAGIDDIRAQVDALLRPFDTLWLEKLAVQAQGIDLARLVEDAPASEIMLSATAASRDTQAVSQSGNSGRIVILGTSVS